MPSESGVQIAVAALHKEFSPVYHPQGYALLTDDDAGASLAVWLNTQGMTGTPRLSLFTPIGPVDLQPPLAGATGLQLTLLAPGVGSLSSGVLLEFPETAVRFFGDWVWLTQIPDGTERGNPPPSSAPARDEAPGDHGDPGPGLKESSADAPPGVPSEPAAPVQVDLPGLVEDSGRAEADPHVDAAEPDAAEPDVAAQAESEPEPEIAVRPLSVPAPKLSTPAVPPGPDSSQVVTLKAVPSLRFQSAGKAQVNREIGSLSLTLRGLPTPARLGTDSGTGRPFAHYHAWLLSPRGRQRYPLGPCNHGWGGNYSLEVPRGLPLAEYDHLLITAGGTADGPTVLTGSLPWAR